MPDRILRREECERATGLSESTEREVNLALGGQNIWVEEGGSVKVKITVEPRSTGAAEGGGKAG